MKWSPRAWLDPSGLGLGALCSQAGRPQPSVAMAGGKRVAGSRSFAQTEHWSLAESQLGRATPMVLEGSGLWEERLL